MRKKVKENTENEIIEIQEDVTVEQSDGEKIILEKGDKVEILKEARATSNLVDTIMEDGLLEYFKIMLDSTAPKDLYKFGEELIENFRGAINECLEEVFEEEEELKYDDDGDEQEGYVLSPFIMQGMVKAVQYYAKNTVV